MTNSTFGCQGNKDNFFFLFFQLYGKQSVPLTEIRAHQLFFTAQLYHIFIRKFIFSNFSYILMNATSISPSLLLLLLYSQPPYSPQQAEKGGFSSVRAWWLEFVCKQLDLSPLCSLFGRVCICSPWASLFYNNAKLKMFKSFSMFTALAVHNFATFSSI